jgi:hypothetical protein
MSRGQNKGSFKSHTQKLFLEERDLSEKKTQLHHSSSKHIGNRIAQTIGVKSPKLALDFYSEIF